MPLYEYECAECGARFERLLSISASVTPGCGGCGSRAVRRLVSRPALLRHVDVGVGRAAYPISWEQTGGGDRETVLHWQRRVEHERRQEAANPELVGLRASAADARWRQAHPEGRLEGQGGNGAGAGHHHHGHPHPSHHETGTDRQSSSAPSAEQHARSGSVERGRS